LRGEEVETVRTDRLHKGVGYDKIYREGRKVLMNILDIEVPLIGILVCRG
jgi:hypothetical protein